MSAKEIKVYEADDLTIAVGGLKRYADVVLKSDHDDALQELKAENQRLRDEAKNLKNTLLKKYDEFHAAHGPKTVFSLRALLDEVLSEKAG